MVEEVVVAAVEDKMTQKVQINIKGMHCKSCADLIENKLKILKGVEEAKVSFVQEQAFVRFDPEQITLDLIKEKIKKIGYKANIENNINSTFQKEKIIRIRFKKPSVLTVLIGITLFFFIVAAFTKGFGLFKTSQTNPDSFLSISLSDITNDVKWYEYNFRESKIRFFAVKANDGTVKTAFDACDVCYTYKKGYRQEGDYMICNNCGNRYPISGLGTENKNPGGCWPGYLPNTIKGNNIIIKKSDLENNRWRSS